MKVFSTVDLRSGFRHCVLDDESSLYRWLRLPFGLSVSSEIFQKHVNQALEDLDGILNIADDILVYGVGETAEQANADHNKKLGALPQRYRESGIALNRDKLELRDKRVKFMGHVLNDNGLEPDPEKIEEIKAMPNPQNVQDVQCLNGFVTSFAKFLPKSSRCHEVSTPVDTQGNRLVLVSLARKRIRESERIGNNSSSLRSNAMQARGA